ncbi:MAG: glucosaminidase domain-containing protein [Bacteroidetes bacterium]|nr:glucosaminidase domain-containing protein [Bacteroidota bacterium]
MNTKARLLLVTVIVFFCSKISAQKPADIENYINAYKEIAISEMQRSGVPASIILAQGIHETEAGTSELVRKSNNHFGIKCKENWTGSVVYHDDDARGECFRSYDTPLDSYKDHSDFLRNSSRYAFLFKLDPMDYQSWAYGLKKAGYATNIRYSQILIKLIEDYNLQQYTLIAMGKMKRPDEQFAENVNEKNANYAKTNTATVSSTSKPVSVDAPNVPQYPTGEFTINNTKVIFARSGASLLSIANDYNMSLARLLDFNDLNNEDVLVKDQLLFLQRKRKVGNNEFHIVREGETLYDICQSEAIRYESLQELNHLANGTQPAVGEKLYLQSEAPSRPALASEKMQQQYQTSTVVNK